MTTHNVNEPVTEEICQFSVGRDKVLARLWEIANMDSEKTRNSMSAQVKAISLIVAIEGLIPARLAASAKSQPAAPQDHSGFYTSEWLRNGQTGESVEPQSTPAPQETQQEPAPEPQSDPASLAASHPPPSPSPAGTSWVPDSSNSFLRDNRFRNDNRFGRRR